MPTSPEEIAAALFQAFHALDAERAGALFAEDARHRVFTVNPDLPLSGTIEGKAAIADHFRSVWRRWPPLRFEIREVLVDGPLVAASASVDAVERDGQRRLRTEAVYFLTVVYGRIVEFDVFFEHAPREAPTGAMA